MGTRRTLHSLLIEAELENGSQLLRLVVKKPRREAHAEALLEVAGQQRVWKFLKEIENSSTKVSLPALIGTLPGTAAIVMEYVPGKTLDKLLVAGSEPGLQDAYRSAEAVGRWLAGFHARGRQEPTNRLRRFPLSIRGYQSKDCQDVPIEASLREIGVREPRISVFVEALKSAADSLPDSLRDSSCTYGDFGVWNLMVSSGSTFILDFPSRLCVDSRLRDICSFLTSVEASMSRPSAIPTKLRGSSDWISKAVSNRFLEGYDSTWKADVEALRYLQVAALVSSWRDLRDMHGLSANSMRLWIEWRIVKRLNSHVERRLDGTN